MLASLKWLSEYTDFQWESEQDVQKLCDRLDLTGTGVEGNEDVGGNFDQIVTGQIVEKKHHPDSDHMWVCMVDVGKFNVDENGNGTPLQIVCGAQNFEENDKIVVSLVGAVLPGGVKIKKSKLRGVVSNGMNCSERELGLGNDHDGIIILPPDAPVGVPFADYLGKRDKIVDLEITPNRPDCLSIQGLAREFAAINNATFRDPVQEPTDNLPLETSGNCVEDEIEIAVEDAEICPRYSAFVIKGITVGESPDWLVERLASVGQRSVNNVVDVTNYIMFLLGQPLHAFDLDWLKNGEKKASVVVRSAHEGEELVTLDGQARKLRSDMTLITTKSAGAVGLAGVMGGLNSEIVDSTKNIMVEVATFNPGRTSRTSRNLKLFSEASMRYERRVDDFDIEKRALLAAKLIVDVAGGKILPNKQGKFGLVDVWKKKSKKFELTFRMQRFQEFVGADISQNFAKETLVALGCDVKVDGENLTVFPPTYRPDLTREVDLYEEVLRIYGEDKIPSSMPKSEKRVGRLTDHDIARRKLDEVLVVCGLHETISYSFASEQDVELFGESKEGEKEPLKVINPLNADHAFMRVSLIPSLLNSAAFNLAHGNSSVKLFEFGKVYNATKGQKSPKEREKIAAILCGDACPASWTEKPRDFDFFDIKGVVENVLDAFNVKKIKFKPIVESDGEGYLHPKRSAYIFSGGTLLGIVGQIHPSVCSKFELTSDSFVFEIDFKLLLSCANDVKPFKQISEYPSVEIDQNFVVDDDVTSEDVTKAIKGAIGKFLDSFELIDIYKDDKKLGVGKKSLTYRFEYLSFEKTLKTEEVEKAHAKLVAKVNASTGATLREIDA